MQTRLHEGQRFVVTNPDYNVWHEVWEIVALAHPEIRFSSTTYNAVDLAYVQYVWTETRVGTIFRSEEGRILVALARHPSPEVGLLLEEDKATYLRRLDPLEYA